MSYDKHMTMALLLTGTGTHVAAWRHPSTPVGNAMNLEYFIGIAKAAEKCDYDLLFIADNLYVNHQGADVDRRYPRHAWPDFEPLTLLAALSAVTSKIGLAATVSTTYSSPYNVARAFASLDHLSGGRAGWNIVTSQSNMEASNFGFDLHAQHADRYARAAEFVDVTIKLWESWEKDAVLANKAQGIALDPSKLHTINHKGKFYDVQGPLNISRSPQGRPVLIQAGSSDAGQDLAAEVADIVFTAQDGKAGAQRFYKSIKGRLQRFGRTEDQLLVMPGVFAVVGKTDAEAQEKFDSLQELIDPAVGLSLLGGILGDLDLSEIDVDKPLPPVADTNASKSRLEMVQRMGADEHLTVRELYTRLAPARGHLTLVGSAEYVADTMMQWQRDEAADGFMLVPGMMPASMNDFNDLVLPILSERGVIKTGDSGKTLRERLGLPEPVSQVQELRAF